MIGLLHSRKFLTAVLDTVVTLATYFVGKYAGASTQDLLILVGCINSLAALIIVGITAEDTAALKAGAHRSQRGEKAQ